VTLNCCGDFPEERCFGSELFGPSSAARFTDARKAEAGLFQNLPPTSRPRFFPAENRATPEAPSRRTLG